MKPKRWIPKPTDKFWYVDADLCQDCPEFTVEYVYFEDWMDEINCFRTKREATIAMNKIIKILGGK